MIKCEMNSCDDVTLGSMDYCTLHFYVFKSTSSTKDKDLFKHYICISVFFMPLRNHSRGLSAMLTLAT